MLSSAGKAAVLELRDVAKGFSIPGPPGPWGRRRLIVHPVLEGISLRVERGEICAVVGPSGAGKSTVLGILAGLVQPDRGEVQVLGRTGPHVLGAAAYMPQRDALLPWRSVLDNVALAFVVARRTPLATARREAAQLLARFGLDAYASARPEVLSGGMRQRVAFLRTLATGREVLLLDEPFGALDALTRAQLEDWLAQHVDQWGVTALLVTHDVEEAVYLADRVLVLSGRPARFTAQVRVDLPRPRRRAMLLEASSQRLRRQLFSALGLAVEGDP
jgi:ABC-type nitrate/sulfonate/bicarbonate transport system ATPase subunit